MKTIIKIIVGIVVLIVFCSAIIYSVNPSFFDSFVSIETKKSWELKRAGKLFPKKIGIYTLFGESSKEITINKMCNKIEDNPTLKATGKTGEACMETWIGEYRQTISSTTEAISMNTVKINLSKFTQSADLLKLLVEKTTTPEILYDRSIFRLSSLQIGWSPESKFDLIVTQETLTTISTTTIRVDYSSSPTGDNDVTRYFLSKYKPKK